MRKNSNYLETGRIKFSINILLTTKKIHPSADRWNPYFKIQLFQSSKLWKS